MECFKIDDIARVSLTSDRVNILQQHEVGRKLAALLGREVVVCGISHTQEPKNRWLYKIAPLHDVEYRALASFDDLVYVRQGVRSEIFPTLKESLNHNKLERPLDNVALGEQFDLFAN